MTDELLEICQVGQEPEPSTRTGDAFERPLGPTEPPAPVGPVGPVEVKTKREAQEHFWDWANE